MSFSNPSCILSIYEYAFTVTIYFCSEIGRRKGRPFLLLETSIRVYAVVGAKRVLNICVPVSVSRGFANALYQHSDMTEEDESSQHDYLISCLLRQ